MPKHTPPTSLIPLHLTLSMLNWQSSMSALSVARHVWPSSKARAKATANAKKPKISDLLQLAAEDAVFADAVAQQAHQQLIRQVETLERFYTSHYERDVQEPPCVWHSGNARLLDYTTSPRPKNKAVLLVPSLINRYHILDLTEERSFARFLARNGYAVYLLDWGEPGARERQFDCADYVSKHLKQAATWIHAQCDRELSVIGHCMGGVLATGLASHAPELVDELVLLATPWDFHEGVMLPSARDEQTEQGLRQYLDQFDSFPGDHLLAWFYLRDPWVFHDKLEEFDGMDEDSDAHQQFLALEYWVGDAVPVARRVARECFIDWGIHNSLQLDDWRIGRQRVSPEEIDVPCLVVAPKHDRIVPLPAAMALAERIPECSVIQPESGHVGMLVGSGRQKNLLTPLLEWLES